MPDTDKLTAALDEIRERTKAATPGPWRWRGNMDNGDPYLAGGHHRDEDGKPVGFAEDVLGHIPHEITRDEARRRVSLDCLPEPEVAYEPCDTYDQRYEAATEQQIELAAHEQMTDKWGEPERESRLAFCSDYMYTTARELAIFEVCPQATHREDQRVYRADITGIRHPNAEFIAHSRVDVSRLLAVVDAVLKEHRKSTVYALSVRAYDSQEPPRIWCGHTLDEVEDDRTHELADDGSAICLDKPEGDVCQGCFEEGGEPVEWPCPTYRAISRALLGEDGTDG